MAGTHLDEEIHIANVRVGTPSRELIVVLNFSGDALVMSSAPSTGSTAGDVAGSDPAEWSSSYSPLGGGTDLIQVSGRKYRVPTSFSSTAAVLAGCPSCHGVLGVGPGSPIWLVWSRATFSAGAVTFGRRLPQVDGSGRTRIACRALETDLCVARATLFGDTYDVHFRFASAFTVLPAAVYDRFVGTRSVSNTPIQEWPSLKMVFASADFPVDPRRVVLRIAPSSFIGNSRTGGAQTLLLRRSTDPGSNQVILSRTTFRSIMLLREFHTGTAVVVSFDSTKRFPVWALAVAIILALLLARWWTTRDALFYEALPGQGAQQIKNPRLTPIAARYTWKPHRSWTSNWIDTLRPHNDSWTSLKRILLPGGGGGRSRSPGNNINSRRFGQRVGRAVPRENTEVWVGETTAPWGPFTNTTFPGEWGVYPDRMLIELVAIGAAIATLYIPSLRRSASSRLEYWVFLQVVAYVMIAWMITVWVTRLFGQAQAFGVLHYYALPTLPPAATGRRPSRNTPLSFVIFRASLIRQAGVDVLLSIALVMVSSLTRTDTLGTTVIAVSTGILAGVVMYHFMAAVVHLFRFNYRYPVGRRGEGVWVIWIIVTALLLGTTAAFTSAFVFIPFMQLHVTTANAGDYILAIVAVYGFGLYLAFVLANYEADRMADWLLQLRGRPRKPPAPHPLVQTLQEANHSNSSSSSIRQF